MSTFDEAVEAAARVIYFACEVTGQGDATWDELVATYGDDYSAIAMYRSAADLALTAAGLPELLAENERLREDLRLENQAYRYVRAERDEARAALARVHRVREKWATDGMPVDFDSVLFDLDDALGDEARAALAAANGSSGCDICGKPSTHVTTPGGMRGCDDHFGGRS